MAAPVRSTSSPSSRPSMRVSPTASAPRIRARCEIDLSPGTRTRPVEAASAAGRQRRDGAGMLRHGGRSEGAIRLRPPYACGGLRAVTPQRGSQQELLPAPARQRAIDRAALRDAKGRAASQPVSKEFEPWQNQNLVRNASAPTAAQSSTISTRPDHLPEMRARCSRSSASRCAWRPDAARPRAPLPVREEAEAERAGDAGGRVRLARGGR